MILKQIPVLFVFLTLSWNQVDALKCTQNCTPTAPPGLPCGNWASYLDEQCFKMFETAGMISFENAEKFCQEEGAELISIHYPEVQAFLTNLFFVKGKMADNIWLGANTNADKVFKWQDNSSLTFTNWAEKKYPRNRLDYCMQMSSDPDWLGKWTDELCGRSNRVACQKKPILQLTQLQEVLFAVKQSLANTQKDYELTKESLNGKQQSPVPVGFVYIQYPQERQPSEIWPSMTWTDVSSTYAGLFFRVLGGSSASFGVIQGGLSPKLEHVSTEIGKDKLNAISVSPGSWGRGLLIGKNENDPISVNFYVSGNEVRPRNQAVRVWRRTA